MVSYRTSWALRASEDEIWHLQPIDVAGFSARLESISVWLSNMRQWQGPNYAAENTPTGGPVCVHLDIARRCISASDWLHLSYPSSNTICGFAKRAKMLETKASSLLLDCLNGNSSKNNNNNTNIAPITASAGAAKLLEQCYLAIANGVAARAGSSLIPEVNPTDLGQPIANRATPTALYRQFKCNPVHLVHTSRL